MNRREFVRTAGGAAGAAATLSATGAAAAQEEGGDGAKTVPDYGGFLDSVGNFDGSTVDATGQDTVTVEVGVQANGGAYGFGPPAVHVDNGATVQFEWTGNGGGHNVVSDGDGPLDSGSTASSAGVNYEHTFEEDGIYPYLCVPHEGLNMKALSSSARSTRRRRSVAAARSKSTRTTPASRSSPTSSGSALASQSSSR